MAANTFVCWSDGLGPGRLTIIEERGAGHWPTQIAYWAGHLTIFPNVRGLPGRGGGMIAAGIDSHIVFEIS